MENPLIDAEETITKLKEILIYIEKISKLSVTAKVSHDFINSSARAQDNGKD